MNAGYEAGLALLARGTACLPFDARFRDLEGKFLAALGRYEEADAAFGQALALSPNDPSIHASQAQARLRVAMARDGLDVFGDAPDPAVAPLLELAEGPARRALALCPVLPAAEEALGRAALLGAAHSPGRAPALLELAREQLGRALRHSPRNRAEINAMLAKANEELGDTEAALAAYARAVEERAGDEALWEAFAALAWRTQAYIDALHRQIAAQRSVEGGLLNDLTMRAAHSYSENQKTLALGQSLAREVLERAPEQADAWGLLAAGPEVLPRLRAVVEERPGAPAWIVALAAQPEGEAFAQAAEALRQAARSEADTGAPVARLARRYAWAARAVCDAAVVLTQDGAQRGRALAAAGEVYVLCGRWEEAVDALGQALPLLLAEERVAPLTQRAAALAALRRFKEALLDARSAVAVNPGAVAVRLELARRLFDAGQLAEAHFEYGNLAKRVPQDAVWYSDIVREARRTEARLEMQATEHAQ
jgi:tetratricopeptide (TPR) repeat protein